MRLSTDWKIERLEIYLNKTLMSENVKRQQTSLRCLFMHSQFLLTNLSKSMMLLAVIGPGQSQNKDYLISASSSFIFDTIWKSFYTKCLKLYGAKSVIIRVTRTVICIPFCVKWLRRTTVWLEVMSTGSFSCMVQKLLPYFKLIHAFSCCHNVQEPSWNHHDPLGQVSLTRQLVYII